MQYSCIHDQHPHSNAESRELVSISTNSKLWTIIYFSHCKNRINKLLHIWSIKQLNFPKNNKKENIYFPFSVGHNVSCHMFIFPWWLLKTSVQFRYWNTFNIKGLEEDHIQNSVSNLKFKKNEPKLQYRRTRRIITLLFESHRNGWTSLFLISFHKSFGNKRDKTL